MTWTADNFNFKGFSYICKLNQSEVMAFIMNSILEYYEENDVIFTKDYIICKGKSPVMFCCHMDTVSRSMDSSEKKYVCIDPDEGVVTSPQLLGADDRCGVYTLLTLINYTEKDKMPWCVFTTNEETGCVGANVLCEEIVEQYFEDIKFIVEIDRRGSNDCVFYSCGNTQFHSFIQDNTGYVKTVGSSSDCKVIGAHYDIGAVNLSAGYYNEHNKHEHMVISELCRTISTCFHLLDLSLLESTPKFNYLAELKYSNINNNFSYNNSWDNKIWDKKTGKYIDIDFNDDFNDKNPILLDKISKEEEEEKNDKNLSNKTQKKIKKIDEELIKKYKSMTFEDIKNEYLSQKKLISQSL